MPRPIRLALLLLVPAVATPVACWAALLVADTSPSGLRVEGEPLAPVRNPSTEVATRAERWETAEVRVHVGHEVLSFSRRELGARVDRAQLERELRRFGRTGNPLTDIADHWRAWSGQTDLRFEVHVDPSAARQAVDQMADRVDRAPRPAELDARGRLVQLSADGLRVQRAPALAVLVEALARGRHTVEFPVDEVASGLGDSATAPVVRPPPPPVLVARYRTRLRMSGSERGRGHNVATAAGYLDGTVIPPLGRFSFNDQVGERSPERGYRMAHVILDGEMVDGMGGGVCQVASTLHAAAFLAGLPIVDHVPHSRPSAYIPMGLDATVVWPNVDLGFLNPFPFPLTVRAWARDGEMVVELYGERRVRNVDWQRRTLSTEPFGDRYVEDPEVSEGTQTVSQRGIVGYLVLRERTMEDATGVHLEERHIRYPPTDRIIRVAPGALDPSGVPWPGPVPDNPY